VPAVTEDAAGAPPVTEAAAEAPAEPEEAAETGEGRRRRRGRGERRRDEDSGVASEESPVLDGAAAALTTQDVAAPEQPVLAAIDEAPTAPVPFEAVAEPVVLAEPIAVAPVAAEPVAAPFVLATDSLAQLAQEAGLEWVNSNADKVRAVQEAIASEPKPVHVPREIRRIELPDDGPLVLVETRRDLAAVTLPFEQPAS